jgi:SWI/SNF-related matrix-associated actin-dependent regulator of chromatin subfamily A3
VVDDEDEEEEDGSQEAPDSLQGNNDHQYNWTLYGSMREKIVGVRYYNGYATVGEMVIPRREPQIAYDSRLALLSARRLRIDFFHH